MDRCRMFMTPGYSQDADADNVRIFHGREIRQVPHASGGMGFVLQLSMAEGDPEGWTPEDRVPAFSCVCVCCSLEE